MFSDMNHEHFSPGELVHCGNDGVGVSYKMAETMVKSMRA